MLLSSRILTKHSQSPLSLWQLLNSSCFQVICHVHLYMAKTHIWNYYRIESSVEGIPSTRLYYTPNSVAIRKYYSNNTRISKQAFKPVSMKMLAVCLFITISSCLGFIVKSVSSVVNCSNKRSNPSLPRVYMIAEDSNRFDSIWLDVKNIGMFDLRANFTIDFRFLLNSSLLKIIFVNARCTSHATSAVCEGHFINGRWMYSCPSCANFFLLLLFTF